MAKIKTKKATKGATKMANGSASEPKETPEELYNGALAFMEQNQPDEALKKAQKLWQRVQNQSISETLPALNLLGEINVELGDVESAKGYFEAAVALDPEGKIPETAGGGSEKFLWLAQLSTEGGKESVAWFEKGAHALQGEISVLESGATAGLDEESRLVMRMEKKRKLANALCGIVEVYMTDLSWEDDAEARCESLITEAMSVEDETSPEVLQTLASVRLSQERKEDAQAALKRSIDIWKDLDPEDPSVPDFPTRISLSRLLMEANLEDDATEIINRLIQEDDESVEAWYLGGWCQYLIAQREKEHLSHNKNSHEDEEQNVTATFQGSRHWLKTAMKLYDLVDYEDERLFEHAQELVTDLDAVLGPEDAQAEGGDEDWDDEWGGIVDDEGDEEMEDV